VESFLLLSCKFQIAFVLDMTLVRRLFHRLFIVAIILLHAQFLYGQRVDNESAVKRVHTDGYWRIFYDNDFIGWTDYYYTQGLNVELVKPSLMKNPVNKLFFRLAKWKSKYGLALDHWGLTPFSIMADSILYGDRPYCGIISLNSFRISIDQNRKRQLTTSFTIGLTGPIAGGQPLQTAVHKWMDDPLPQGWKYQLRTDLILNYKIGLEKNLLSTDFFLFNGNAEVRAGTLHNKLSGGFNFMLGKLNNPFLVQPNSNWQVYAYGSSLASVIAFDATLQGGLFNDTHPYTLSAQDVKRITLQNRVGLVLNYKKIYVELAQTFLSKEFEKGLRHRWGSASFGLTLN
jgi:lipid A 3-O-deacylase